MEYSSAGKSIVIIPSWYPGSSDPVAGIFIEEQARALAVAGLNISVFVVEELGIPGFSVLSNRVIDQLPTIRIKAFIPPKRFRPFRRYWFSKWEILLERYRLVNQRFPDLLHAHSFVGGAVARFFYKRYKIPYVITEHYDGFISGKIPTHWRDQLAGIYQDAQKVLAVSPGMAQALKSYTQNVEIIPNLINTDHFFPASPRKNAGVPSLISVGALEPRKNHSLLIKTFARIRRQFPLNLTIIGDGPLMKPYQKLVNALGVNEFVTFTGNLSPKEVSDYLRQAQLFVSVSTSESFAIAPLEALACAVPVIILKNGSILEKLEYEAVGILDGEHDLENTIVSFLQKDFQNKVITVSQMVREKFGPEAFVQRMRGVYDSVE